MSAQSKSPLRTVSKDIVYFPSKKDLNPHLDQNITIIKKFGSLNTAGEIARKSVRQKVSRVSYTFKNRRVFNVNF